MIIGQEYVDWTGQLAWWTHEKVTKENIQNYVRTFKVTHNGYVELIPTCKARRCGGRGYMNWQAPNGIKYVTTCSCVDKILSELGIDR